MKRLNEGSSVRACVRERVHGGARRHPHSRLYSAKRRLLSASVFETSCPPAPVPQPNLPVSLLVVLVLGGKERGRKESIFGEDRGQFSPSFIFLHSLAGTETLA